VLENDAVGGDELLHLLRTQPLHEPLAAGEKLGFAHAADLKVLEVGGGVRFRFDPDTCGVTCGSGRGESGKENREDE